MKFVGLRRQAEPDRQLQHLERAGQGAPGRARLRRPGQPGRGVARRGSSAAGREEAARRRLRPRPGRDGGRHATATSRRSISPEHWLKGYLAVKLMADAKHERQGAARGHVELRRADRQQEEHRRDHHPPEGRREPRRVLQGEVDKQLAQPRPVPRAAVPGGTCSRRAASRSPTAASSRSPARTSRSAPARCTRCSGENGAGKSTLVKIIAGALRAGRRGRVRLDGKEVRSPTRRRRSARGVAVVSQELNLFPDLDVLANLFPMRELQRGPFISPARDGRARAAGPRGARARRARCAAGRRADARRAPAGRDRQGAADRAARADPRRADLGARARRAPRRCSTSCACCATARSASCSSRTSSRT